MKAKLRRLLFYLLLPAAMTAYSQQVKDFSLPNAVDGKTVSLAQFKSYEWLMLVFTSNECAYDNYYRERLALLGAAYRQSVPLLLINAHPEPSESLAAMQLKYRQWALDVPYLADKQQVVMTLLEAKKSPEVFLLRKKDGLYTVMYRGSIDDNPQVPGDVDRSYLKEAIDSLTAGKKPEWSTTRPVGCTIRKK